MCSVLFVGSRYCHNKSFKMNQIEEKLLAYISVGTTTEYALFGVMYFFMFLKLTVSLKGSQFELPPNVLNN